MSTNQHSATNPSPPICVFLMTRHSVISFRLKRWVQAVSHTCPGQRFLERASTRLHRVYVITKVVWYRSEIVATILFTTLQFPQFIPNLWTIGSSISLSFGSFSQNWARNFAQELLVRFRGVESGEGTLLVGTPGEESYMVGPPSR